MKRLLRRVAAVWLAAVGFAPQAQAQSGEWRDVTKQYVQDADLSQLNGWTTTGKITPNNNVAEAYAGWGKLEQTSYGLTQTVTLPAGNFRLEGYAFFRQGQYYDTDATKSLATMVAGEKSIPVPTLGSIERSSYANDMAQAAAAFYTDNLYLNTIDFTVEGESQQVEIGFKGTFDEMYSWCIVGKVKLSKYMEYSEIYEEAYTKLKESTDLPAALQKIVDDAVAEYAETSDYKAAAEALEPIVSVVEECKPLIEELKALKAKCEESAANSTASAGLSRMLETAIAEAGTSLDAATAADEFKAAIAALEKTRQNYVLNAAPNDAEHPLDYNFLVAEVGNSKNGWTDSFSAEYTHPDNYQYQNADNKNNADLGLYKKGYIEAWNAGTDFTGTLTYTKNDLPNGHYKISAYAFTSKDGKTSFTANGKEVPLDNTTDIYTQPVIDDVTVSDGTLTFGLKIEGANWIGITNIQLQLLSKPTVCETILTEENGYTKITEMPAEADLEKYYFIITDKNKDLMMTLGTGSHQEGNKTMWYRTATDPSKDTDKAWVIAANNGVNEHETGYAFRGKNDENFLQTGKGSPWNFKTGELTTPNELTQFLFVYDSTGEYWTFENGANSGLYVGTWEEGDDSFINGAEVAANKQGNYIGHFVIYTIERETLDNKALNDAKDKANASLDEYESVLTNSTAEEEVKGTYSEAIEAAKTAVADAASEEDVDNAMSAVETARREYVQVATPEEGYPFDMTFLIKNAEGAALDGWTVTGKTLRINKGQHWDGTAGSGYLDTDNWSTKGWTIGISQSIAVPNGKYTLTATGRASEFVTLTLTAGEDTITFPALGGSGGSIATDGTEWESVEAGLIAGKSFANNDYGWGWTIGKVSATVGEGTLTIDVVTKTDSTQQWCSISDFKLLKTGATTAEEELAAAKKALQTLINTAEAISDDNVGDGAFQIPTAAYTKLGEAIAAAKSVNDSEETDATALTEAKTALQAAVDEYNGTALNPPAEGKRYNIVLTYAVWKDNQTVTNQAVTYIANDRSDAGNYNMKYLKEVDANYAQAFTFTAAAETGNTYYLSQTDEDGNERYVCTGTTYGGNNDQLRTTTNKEEALAVEVRLVADTTGIYNLYNTAAAKYIGSQDDGFFTVNSYIDFKLLEAKEAEVTLTMPESGWATLMLPFDAEVPEGLTAYTCESIGTSSEAEAALITLAEASTLKAHTPYILKGTGEHAFSGYGLAKQDTYATDYMTGVYVATEAAAGVFTLTEQDGKAAFIKAAEGVTAPAYSAYVNADAKGTEGVLVILLEDKPDGITGIAAEDVLVNVYDLNGILVRQNVKSSEALQGLAKGIYIVNGAKKAVK